MLNYFSIHESTIMISFPRYSAIGTQLTDLLLLSVLRHSHLKRDDQIQVTRIGGYSEKIYALELEFENELENSKIPHTTIGTLLTLLADKTELLFLLICGDDRICFGLFDGDFHFVQAKDKAIEQKIARDFDLVTFLLDAPDFQFQ